jgi:hypothetical protein
VASAVAHQSRLRQPSCVACQHFLMKRLLRVATEMALHVLACNLTRELNIVGIKPILAAVGA